MRMTKVLTKSADKISNHTVHVKKFYKQFGKCWGSEREREYFIKTGGIKK